jgi:hypothetical protein
MTVPIRHGKHKGKTIEWLFFNDPGYYYWMRSEGIHEKDHWFNVCQRQELAQLHRRASHLKIPGTCIFCKKKPNSVMIMVCHSTGGLTSIDFDCEDCRPPGGGWVAMTPSFYTPDIFRNYDKTGGKFLVHSIKHAYFGNSSHRMTAKRLEKFWGNDDNFVNP